MAMTCGDSRPRASSEFRMDNVRILLPVADADPHLSHHVSASQTTTQPPHDTHMERDHSTDLPERTQPRQNTPPNPGTILALRRRPDLDPHVLDGQSLDLVQKSVAEALGQRRAAGEDDVAEEGLTQIHIGAVDGVDDHVMQAGILQADNLRVEENFRGAKAFRADLDGRHVNVMTCDP